MGAAIGATGVAAAGPLTTGAAAAHGGHHGGDRGHGRLVPSNRIRLQQWSIRDAITRRDRSCLDTSAAAASGRTRPTSARSRRCPAGSSPFPLPGLGRLPRFRALQLRPGRRRPDYRPADQGGSGQRPPRRRGHSHRGPAANGRSGLPPGPDRARPSVRLPDDRHGRQPGEPSFGSLAAWTRYAGEANTVGAALRREGIKYFFDPEQDWFRFFEPDTMHTLAGRARFPDPVDGSLFDLKGWYGRLAKQGRLIARHIKDADRNPLPAPGTNPFVQEHVRPLFPLNGSVEVVYVGEGSIGKGHPANIDREVLGLRERFRRDRLSDPGWFDTESDSGPGPAADPGRSLRWAKVSAAYMRSLQRAQGHREVHVRG